MFYLKGISFFNLKFYLKQKIEARTSLKFYKSLFTKFIFLKIWFMAFMVVFTVNRLDTAGDYFYANYKQVIIIF